MQAMPRLCSEVIWPNLELKTLPKQLLGYLPLDIALTLYRNLHDQMMLREMINFL